MMRADDLRRLSGNELADELEDAYRELMNVRFRIATRQLQNVHEERSVRKRIARMKTLQRERELGIRV